MEGEKDHWNVPSTSKAGQYFQNENEEKLSASSGCSLDREIPPTDIILTNEQTPQHDSPALHGQEDKKYVAIQNQPIPAPTYFFESDIKLISDPDDHPTDKGNVTPSVPTTQVVKESGGLNEPQEDGGGLETSDQQGQNIPSDSKSLNQKIDTKNVGRKLSAVEASLAEIFCEMTGALCYSHDNHANIFDEMTTSYQRKNSNICIPFFSGFTDLLENELESEGTKEDTVKEEAKVEANSLPEEGGSAAVEGGSAAEEGGSAAEEVKDNTQSPQPVPSSQNPRDPEEEMYEFLNTIYNPSPYIQKKKLEYEKNKLSQYNEKVAMKIMEKMIMSSMSTLSDEPVVSQGPPLKPEQLDNLAQKVNELEKRLHQIDREKRESEREKKNLLEQVNELELRALEMKKAQLMKRIMSSDEPSQKDIELLDQLKELVKYQNESTKELRELERQNRVMERVLSHAERSLLSSPWFHKEGPKASAHNIEVPPMFVDPSPKRKIRFNHVGTVVFFDNRDPPMKVPHWNSELVEQLTISPGDHEKWDVDDEDLMEEKMDELRRKKEEEKLVKMHSPFDEEEDEEGRVSDISVNENSSPESSTKERELSTKEEQK